MNTEMVRANGYEQAPLGEYALRIRGVVFLRGRTWVLSCSKQNDGGALAHPEIERALRPSELFVLGLSVVYLDVLATKKQATNYLQKIWCRSIAALAIRRHS